MSHLWRVEGLAQIISLRLFVKAAAPSTPRTATSATAKPRSPKSPSRPRL